jgi:sugar-specific transcriptional regulator TrmB
MNQVLVVKSCHPMIDQLVRLGLTPTEALIYTTLLKTGASFVAPIVQQTQKHRHIVYQALEKLEEKNLITVAAKDRKRFYSISDPKRLLVNAEQTALLARQVTDEVAEILQKEKELVESFSGATAYQDGLADFRRNAEQAKEYIVIGGQSEEWYEHAQPFFADHVSDLQRLRRQGIDIFLLFFENEWKGAEKYLAPYKNDPYIIRVSKASPRLPHTTWLAGDHVYILTPTKEPKVIHIISRPFAQEYRTYFNTLWKSSDR